MRTKRTLWLTVAAVAAAAGTLLPDAADAGQRRAPKRRRHRSFLTAQGQEKTRTPDPSSADRAPSEGFDVATGSAQGDGRQTVLDGGAAVVLSATRALVANPWSGLSVVDVSDPGAPAVIGSVALTGSAERVFTDGAVAIVVSRLWDATGGRTQVATVDLSDEAHPALLGTAVVDGDLAQASASGSALIVVTQSSQYGYWLDAAGGPMAGVAKRTMNGGRDPSHGGVHDGIAYWNQSGTARVARIERDAAGAPTVVGVVERTGSLLASDVDGDGVALVLDPTQWGPIYTYDLFAMPRPELIDVDASAAPVIDGTRSLQTLWGVWSLDLAGDAARLVGWSDTGSLDLLTFTMTTGDPQPLATYALPQNAGTLVFAGDRLVYQATGDAGYGPGDPGGGSGPGDGSSGDPSNGGFFPRKTDVPGNAFPDWTPPAATLGVVDLSDDSAPASAGTVTLGTGWVQSILAAGSGVVVPVSSGDANTTHLSFVDLSGAPAVSGTADVDGSFYPSQSLGDLVLLNGWTQVDEWTWEPQTLPVSVAGGTLAAGAPFASASWTSSAAWQSPILALASVDRLSLVDLSDLANPAPRGSVALAVNVTGFAALGDAAGACLVTDYVEGNIEIRTVALPEADPLRPIDTVSVGTGDARLFRDGSTLYVLASDWATGGGSLSVVDASDPSNLTVTGSLALASYPGQAFLVDGAMVLLRPAWSLVTENGRGKMVGLADPFGKCRGAWANDDQGSVLDVIDLSDPSNPRAAVRKRIRWDFGGEAMLRGSTLYVPSYFTAGSSPDGYPLYLYGVRAVDLSSPLSPRIGRLVDVPGTLVGATDTPGRVLTVTYAYDPETWEAEPTLHSVDLRIANWRERVLASLPLDGYPGAVVVGGSHAWIATERWNYEDGSATYALGAVDLSDLTLASSQERERTAWGGTLAGGLLFLRSWGWTGALDVYDVSDAADPAFRTSAEVDGIGTDISVTGGRAYVPAGYRGVQSFGLGD